MSSILKVDEIQNTGGTTGLTIDSAGRLLKPVIPFGQFGGPASTTSGGNIITFAGRIVSGGGMTADSTNHRMIVPVAGLYAIGFTQLVDNVSNNTLCYMRKNGTKIDGTSAQTAANSQYGSMAIHHLITLAANDYIEWWCQGGTIYAGDSSYSYNNHYIYLLG